MKALQIMKYEIKESLSINEIEKTVKTERYFS
jgi:hypothetical protein